jgi:Ca2+-binding RTX toxin-like protein
MEGLGGDDLYYVHNANDTIIEAAGAGTDRVLTSVSFVLRGGQSIDALTPTDYASTTNLHLTGNTLHQSIFGNAGDNILDDGGAGAPDTMEGLDGNDLYYVNNSGDTVIEAANAGTDRVLTSVSFTLGGEQSIEALTPTDYHTVTNINLSGNELAQSVIGNAGDNVIAGAAGNDTLEGLGGADTFVFDTALNAATNVDRILDFTQGSDLIELDHAIFTALAPANPLPSADFTTGAPTTPDQHIIYNTSTGALSYDDDGSGAHAAVQFAILSGHPALANTDIFVV